MASTNAFTTAAKVKSRLKNFNAAITDSEVETYISHAEAFIIAFTKVKWKTTIPELVESVATDLAALYLLANDPSGFTSITEAAFIADVLWASSNRNLIFLRDNRTIEFLKGNQ